MNQAYLTSNIVKLKQYPCQSYVVQSIFELQILMLHDTLHSLTCYDHATQMNELDEMRVLGNGVCYLVFILYIPNNMLRQRLFYIFDIIW